MKALKASLVLVAGLAVMIASNAPTKAGARNDGCNENT